MQFKELKSNYIVYVFDKHDMTCKEAKVSSVSVPRFDNKLGQSPNMVVDVTLDIDGKQNTYVFPDNAQKAFNGNLSFCIDKADLISDVKAVLRASEQIILDIPHHKEVVTKCNGLLADLDTEEKAKQEMENRLSKIEGRFDSIEMLLKKLADKKV